jgi:AraC-like DNA-binding protein
MSRGSQTRVVVADAPLDSPSARRAVYGTARRLGDVEFLSARFTGHRFAPHSHPVFAVGAVRSGACRIWHRGVSYVAQPGDLVLVNPGAPHSADPAADQAWDYCAIYFSTDCARTMAGRGSASQSFRTVVGSHPELAAELERLCLQLGSDPECPRLESRFGALVRRLFEHFGGEERGEHRVESDNAPMMVRRHLDAHFAEPVRIDDLAELTGRHPLTLIRAFSRQFGMPPYAYLTHVRVAHAQILLRAGRPISDTAFAVGFCDQSHLTRYFRRVVGVPPGVWVRGVGAATNSAQLPASPARQVHRTA